MSEMWFETPLGRARLAEMAKQADARSNRKVQHAGMRMYSSAKSSRLTDGWTTSNTSADAELHTSLTQLRTRSRALVRDASYAKRAKGLVQLNVIGCGIGMQAQVTTSRGDLSKRVNDEIEQVWRQWCRADSCHTGGRLEFSNMERLAMGQVFEAGEVFVRKHYRAFGSSDIPFALEVIEAERIADELAMVNAPMANGNQIRMGVEVDRFFRPVAYYIRTRHPSEYRWSGGDQRDEVERVPADQIIHLALIDRWPQTRGEPWMHTAARRLNDMDAYSEAEIIRARSQATTIGAIETPEDAEDFAERQDDGSYEMEFEAGVVRRLNPGEKLHAVSPTAPNPAMDPFMRYMLREIAAGIGASYESLSRDYGQANYSSARQGILEDRDLWRVFQGWFIKSFRHPVHEEWLRAAIYSRQITSVHLEEFALNPQKFTEVRFKPRGWSWIDPTKEVDAFKEAVKAGFITVSDVISQTANGRDIEDVLNERARELELMEEKDLVFDTSPESYVEPEPEPPPNNPPKDPEEEPAPRRVFSFPRSR